MVLLRGAESGAAHAGVTLKSRLLLLAATTGYQTRAFDDAAERMGVDLVLATDRCDVLDDPWRDRAIPIRFYDQEASVAAILEATRGARIDGALAVGDRPTVIAARVLQELGVPGHSPMAAAAARNKLTTREVFRNAGLPVPAFVTALVDSEPADLERVGFPAVVKPVALSGSRGVMRVDDIGHLRTGLARLRALLGSADIVAERSGLHSLALIERFIPGREYAVECLVNNGILHPLAIFDKPDPLDGPFFEETIYVTPTSASDETQRAILDAIGRAVSALGLSHGPIHAECRVNTSGVFVLEVAARPIGGLCARSLRFVGVNGGPLTISLEELLMRHALGEDSTRWRREPAASGVMMIPIPRRGILRGISGVDEARQVGYIDDVRITAKLDQLLIPLPEGASYLGFIFARAEQPERVVTALRRAHERLVFEIAADVRVLQSHHG